MCIYGGYIWVGREHEVWKAIIGHHGVGKCNEKDICYLSSVLRQAWPSLTCHTDQGLVRTKMQLRIRPYPWKEGPEVKKLITNNLCFKKEEFQSKLQSRLQREGPEIPNQNLENSGLNWRLHCKKQQQRWMVFCKKEQGLIWWKWLSQELIQQKMQQS